MVRVSRLIFLFFHNEGEDRENAEALSLIVDNGVLRIEDFAGGRICRKGHGTVRTIR